MSWTISFELPDTAKFLLVFVYEHKKLSLRICPLDKYIVTQNSKGESNKKVLLRERKRHTARRVAIASLCYSGGGVLWQKIFFPVWTCIKLNLVSKIFPFPGGGGVPQQKIFFRSEHVSSQIWCQKIFPLLGGGGPLTKKFFSSLNMYQAKSGVKNFSLYWDWYPPPRCESGTTPSQIWGWDLPPWTWDPPTWTWTWDPPTGPEMGYPPYLDLDMGPPPVDRHTDRCQNITFPSYHVRGQ